MPDWRKSYDDGTAAYKAKDFNKAIRLLNESLNLGGKRFCVLDVRASVFERLKDYEKALKDCRDCIVLDPKSNKPYFRAARICEIQGMQEKAMAFLEHGIQVTPPAQAKPYFDKLALVQKAVERSQPPTTKIDPITVLPEELLAYIFEMVIEDGHPDMPIRLSWVSHSWREMTTNCPFLWRRLSLSGTNYSQCMKRLRIFGQRGQGKLSHIRIDPLPQKDISEFANTLRPYLRHVQTLKFGAVSLDIVQQFTEELQGACHYLQVLCVYARSTTLYEGGKPPISRKLHLGLSASITESKLRSVKLEGLPLGRVTTSSSSAEPTYDRLETLILDHCKIDPSMPLMEGDDVPAPQDIVHSTLRHAKNLRHLEVRIGGGWRSMPREYVGPALQLPKLQVLVIPPPEVWAIHVEVPRIRKLTFSKTPYTTEYGVTGLLPSLKQLAPLQVPVAELEVLEVAVEDRDHQAALRSWLMRLTNLKELAVVSQSGCQEDVVSWGNNLDLIQSMMEAVNNKVVTVLHGRPEWCPQMHSLRLVRCLVPGRELMEYVKARKSSSQLATIRDLTLDHCSALPTEAETWLQRNVENFKIVKPRPMPAGWRDKFR
ncbi:hypothetical protein QFC22_002195 [Naganishia vaughanmartiniae]|uniref:Uncharacterized protein n=1 Tax=Naganishia vaughanmartiniae TaxID=1424756 RepID=A0ACC2XDW1_9TREE|nr:hypothetical protein QFC22_002195 [Naganishia vaughanmartiniae]